LYSRNPYENTESAATTEEGSTEQQSANLRYSQQYQIDDINSGYLIDSSKFNLIKEVGVTANCKVFLTQWNDRDAVIKKIRIKTENGNECKKRYNNEVKFMLRLTEAKAPNIIQFFGYEIQYARHEGNYLPFNYNIVMEYATSGSLDHVIKNTYFLPLNWKLRYEILKGVACGLKHIHSYDIIHRDIKSANILIDQKFQAKISDFGIAIHKDEKPHVCIGTTSYMAPETLASNLYTEKSDMFGFAVTAWELAAYIAIAKMLPKDIEVRSESGKIDVDKTRINQHSFLASEERVFIPKECPKSLAELITWCWQTNPDKRLRASEAELKLEEGLDQLQATCKK
jgi:mitogen-activated protein kinase kinase kinase 9